MREFVKEAARIEALGYSTHDIIDFFKLIFSPVPAFICCISFVKQPLLLRVATNSDLHSAL